MTEETIRENKMGYVPVNKLLVSMATPMIISMLVQALYNIIDSAFVSRIGGEIIASEGMTEGSIALNAVGLAFPIQMLLIAFGTGTSVGVNALLSRALGEKDFDTVHKSANNGVFLSFLNFVVFFILGAFFSNAIISMQGGTGLTLQYGKTYLSIVTMGSIGIYMQLIFERLLQSTGRTLASMCTQLTGAIINIILDPILIFGYIGFPKMGVAGAAIATITGQMIAAIIAIIINHRINKEVKISFKGFKPDIDTIKKIYAVGIPSIIMQSIGSVMTSSMNRILNGLNPASVTVFTVYFKLQSIFFMPLFGLNNGMIPILAYNFGAQKRSRMIKTIKLAMVYGFAFLCIGFILFEAFPDKLLMIFDTGDPSLYLLGIPALRIIGTHYLVAWFCIIGGTVFQSLGNGIYSLIVSVARQLVVLVPVAYLLSRIGGLSLIWWSFPIAEVMSLCVTTFFLIKIYKDVISKVADNV